MPHITLHARTTMEAADEFLDKNSERPLNPRLGKLCCVFLEICEGITVYKIKDLEQYFLDRK